MQQYTPFHLVVIARLIMTQLQLFLQKLRTSWFYKTRQMEKDVHR